jgi:hypothetical protein
MDLAFIVANGLGNPVRAELNGRWREILLPTSYACSWPSATIASGGYDQRGEIARQFAS